MHQKAMVKQAWKAAGLYEIRDKKLQLFLRMLDNCSGDCWPRLIEECRKSSSNYKAQLVDPIWKTGDKTLRLNLIRGADVTRADEAALLQHYAAICDPQRDALELRAIQAKGSAKLQSIVNRLAAMPSDRKALANTGAAPVAVERGKMAPGVPNPSRV